VPGLERDFLVRRLGGRLAAALGPWRRSSGRPRRDRLRAAFLVGLMVAGARAAEHLHLLRNDVGGVTLHAILVGVLAGLQENRTSCATSPEFRMLLQLVFRLIPASFVSHGCRCQRRCQLRHCGLAFAIAACQIVGSVPNQQGELVKLLHHVDHPLVIG
jgi:hypothetical protein